LETFQWLFQPGVDHQERMMHDGRWKLLERYEDSDSE